MASPQIVVFALFNSAQAPLAGQSPTFATYKDETGTNLSQPTISEIGGGFYKFTPVLIAGHGIAYMIDGGALATPQYQYNYLRPEDFYLLKVLQNRWKVVGNQLLIYDDDGTTAVLTFNLFDNVGAPTMTKIFERVPTP